MFRLESKQSKSTFHCLLFDLIALANIVVEEAEIRLNPCNYCKYKYLGLQISTNKKNMSNATKASTFLI